MQDYRIQAAHENAIRCEYVDEMGRQCILRLDHALERDHYCGAVVFELDEVHPGPRIELPPITGDVEAVAMADAHEALSGIAREALPRILAYLIDRLPVQVDLETLVEGQPGYQIVPTPYEREDH